MFHTEGGETTGLTLTYRRGSGILSSALLAAKSATSSTGKKTSSVSRGEARTPTVASSRLQSLGMEVES